jgi:hypothetical protein
MATVTDDQMRAMLATSKDYSILLLRAGPNWDMEGARAIVTEHGRRNFSLRADGLLSIVCRVTDDSDLAGSASSTPTRTRCAASWTTTPVSGPASSSTRSTPA